jgi:hypothetical protein
MDRLTFCAQISMGWLSNFEVETDSEIYLPKREQMWKEWNIILPTKT